MRLAFFIPALLLAGLHLLQYHECAVAIDDDTWTYYGCARMLAGDHPLVLGDFLYRTPGYPLFLLAHASLFGARAGYAVALTQHLLFLLAELATLYLVASRFDFGGWACAFLGGFYLLDFRAHLYTQTLLTEGVTIPLLSLSLAVLATSDGNRKRLLVAGLLMGASYLCRPNILYLPIVLFALMLLMARPGAQAKISNPSGSPATRMEQALRLLWFLLPALAPRVILGLIYFLVLGTSSPSPNLGQYLHVQVFTDHEVKLGPLSFRTDLPSPHTGTAFTLLERLFPGRVNPDGADLKTERELLRGLLERGWTQHAADSLLKQAAGEAIREQPLLYLRGYAGYLIELLFSLDRHNLDLIEPARYLGEIAKDSYPHHDEMLLYFSPPLRTANTSNATWYGTLSRILGKQVGYLILLWLLFLSGMLYFWRKDRRHPFLAVYLGTVAYFLFTIPWLAPGIPRFRALFHPAIQMLAAIGGGWLLSQGRRIFFRFLI